MRKSKDEIRQLIALLSDWQSPAVVLAVTEQVDSDSYFNQPQLKPLQEAWIAATFSKAIGGGNIRVVTDVWPDVEIMLGDRLMRFEVTEAIKAGRRRGDEFKPGQGSCRHVPEEEWRADAEAVPEMLRAAVRKKVEKRYSSGANLLVYLGVSRYGLLYRDNELQLAKSTEEAAGKFPATWVLWGEAPYLVWREGCAWGGGVPGEPFNVNRSSNV